MRTDGESDDALARLLASAELRDAEARAIVVNRFEQVFQTHPLPQQLSGSVAYLLFGLRDLQDPGWRICLQAVSRNGVRIEVPLEDIARELMTEND